MRVKILEDDENTGVKAGEVYLAERYRLDPNEKVILLSREPDGYDPECTEYLRNVEVVRGNAL